MCLNHWSFIKICANNKKWLSFFILLIKRKHCSRNKSVYVCEREREREKEREREREREREKEREREREWQTGRQTKRKFISNKKYVVLTNECSILIVGALQTPTLFFFFLLLNILLNSLLIELTHQRVFDALVTSSIDLHWNTATTTLPCLWHLKWVEDKLSACKLCALIFLSD